MASYSLVHPQKQAVLAVLAETGNIRQACIAAGVGRQSYYDWRNNDPEFAAAAELAAQDAADYLEEVARQRAIRDKNPSDLLLIFLLKGLRPEKYRDNYNPGLNITADNVQIVFANVPSLDS